MEGLSQDTAAASKICQHVARFMLIDVGCSGGIDPAWRILGDKLHAFGFDPNVENCRAIAKSEVNTNIRYVPAFVEIAADHPFAVKRGNSPQIARNPWARLAIHKTMEIRQKQIETMTTEEKTALNMGHQTELAPAHIQLSKFFAENGVDDIDFFKIDIDGGDFDVLNSIEEEFDRTSVLGVGMEVNYIGDDSDTAHTFHNTDRFLRRLGFELFNLTTRKYSAAALPGRYLYRQPSLSNFGRPIQGDAIYVRDLCAPCNADFAERLSPEKLLKTALIFAMIGLPDHAAEVLMTFHAKLYRLCDVAHILNALVEQAAPGCGLTFDEYRAAFDVDDAMFYPA